jgi:hypothetical protein
MRVAVLALAILALATTQDELQQEEPHGAHCVTQCAAIPKDTHDFKSCSCDAGKGASCDRDGNRTQEEMAGCVNRKHCLKGCCHCCPKD